ncbi:MAG TPA: right-handed parallel beta-helix repeat-containing protein [Pseudonocardia sp.]
MAAKQQAALAAKQQAALVKAQVKAAARAAKLAAQQAVAAQRADVTWARRGRPAKLVIVRTTSIDSVARGSLVQRVVRNGAGVSLSGLDAAIPSSWMTIDGDTARLNAAVALTPGTLLDIEGVKTLQLAGGANPADAAVLYTGGGRIQMRGVTVTSADSGSGQPVGPEAPGRPYLVVAASGRLDATDATISDLGTKPTGDNHGHPAVSFGRGSTGALTRVSLLRNATGLVLSRSKGVHLQDVTADDSAENGIILRGDVATVLAGVRAGHNGANGVLVSGQVTSRPITGISTSGNQSYGVSVVGQNNVEISNLALSGDRAGGLELSRDGADRVHNITTADEPNGVFLHINSTNIVLDAITVSGGRTGILAEKTTTGLHVTGSTIEGVHVAGLQIGGKATLLDGLTVKDSRTALRVERGAGGVTVNKVSLIGGTDGLVTSGGTSGVMVNDLSADGVGNDAVRNLSPGMQITGGQIRGGTTGMDLQAPTSVTGIQIGLTSTGIRARAPDPIMLDTVRVDAVAVGVEAQPGSAVTLRSSSIHALEAVRGTLNLLSINDLSLPPLNLLGAIGLPLIGVAIVLELLHLLRQRGSGPTRRRLPPAVAMGTG